MKAGDKVFYVGKDFKGRDSFKVFIIDKISKDGTKFRPSLMPGCSGCRTEAISFDDENLISDYETLENKINDIFSEKNGYENGFLVMDGTPRTCWSSIDIIKIKEIKVDDFDDVLNIKCEKYGNDYYSEKETLFKYPSLRIGNGDYIPNANFRVPLRYIGTADNLLSYLAGFAGFHHTETFHEKFNKWQEKFGYDKTDEFWKDFKGGTEQLEYAIDNDIDCADYDRWQCIQRILKHELKYETANELLNTLYEKEEIEIFECE